ncbi:MAG: trypsin-like peptidase domain-containing protein [Patescibacteria group bacterium]
MVTENRVEYYNAMKRSHISFSVLVLLGSLLAGFVGGVVGTAFTPQFRFFREVGGDRSGVLTPPAPVPLSEQALAENAQTVAVVERILPSVVSIAITKDLSKIPQPQYIDPFTGEQIFPQGVPSQQGMKKIGGGSGFLVSSDGLIVTNKHVVEDVNAEYSVILRNGETKIAKVLARDPVLDLAILDIEGDGFPYVTFGDSDALKTGQTVIAIGNALDEFRNTVTKGIVSGLNRHLQAQNNMDTETIEEAIQTDAAINPGNSGGPLIDLEGRVVGVNTATSFSGQLIGFALPANLAKRDLEQVQKFGRVTRSFLGIRYIVINEDLVKKNQLTVDYGVLISRGADRTDLAVIPGSPADKAGIVENDVILSLNGTKINEEYSLSSLIGRHSPGDVINVRILRHGEERDVSVTLGEFATSTADKP